MGEKNKIRSLIIALIIAIAIIVCLVIYLYYDKVITSNDSKNNLETAEKNTVNKEESIDINSDLVQKLFSIFRLDYYNGVISVDSLNNSNLAKLRLAYDNIPEKDYGIIDCSELDLTSDSSYCGETTSDMDNAHEENNEELFKKYEAENKTDSIDTSIIERKIRELFGSNYKVKNESFGISSLEPSCHYMKYDSNKKVYATFHCIGGGTTSNDMTQELVSASRINNELRIKTVLQTQSYQMCEEANCINEKTTTTNLTYIFTKDSKNGNYVFEKVEESK